MGKGDKKTKKGKITKGSYGNTRPRKVASKNVKPIIAVKETPKKEEAPVEIKEKAPAKPKAEKKPVAKKAAPKKVAEKKETEKKETVKKEPAKKKAPKKAEPKKEE